MTAPRFLGPGREGVDCLADALGKPFALGIEATSLWLVPCAPDEATHVVVSRDATGTLPHHAMRIERRTGPIADWIVVSKLAKRASRYRHRAEDAITGFALDPRDPARHRLGSHFPGYPGVLVPMCRRTVP